MKIMDAEEAPREMMVIAPDCIVLHHQEHMTLKHAYPVPDISIIYLVKIVSI